MSSLTIPSFLSLTTTGFSPFFLFNFILFFFRSNRSHDNGVSLQMSVEHERVAEQ
ncbi:hypothetical protein ARMGADRAFT_827290 [Armillaria gallica]|uniref:Uncharacterized protein n=1 Tax=Armillaria gallica TaxID=47427 RepID=A0A2H3CC36_ARMGA|nr:hypothetical protein ARMGADRAFT_827290 [Armillaria gallica]